MKYKGFIGGSYELDSVIADCSRTINLIPEIIESGSGKGPARFFPRPGLVSFSDFASYTPVSPFKALLQVNGASEELVFGLAPDATGHYALWQIASDGTFWQIATAFAYEAQSLASNGTQVVIACHESGVGAALYCLDLGTYALTLISTLGTHNISQVVWHPDGYFIALDCSDKKIYVSALMDGETWDAADCAQVFVTDIPQYMIVDHKELWIFGQKGASVYYDSGAEFPFEPIPGVSLQTGIVGKSADRLDNTLFWVSQSERGGYQVCKAAGHTPVRVSNNGIEQRLIDAAPTPDTISVFAMDYNGHSFFVISVDGDESSLVFDASTGLWHEWATNGGIFLGRHHCFAWGKHLFTSNAANVVYELDSASFYDGATAITWMRRAPHLAAEGQRVFYHRFMLDMQTGITGSVSPSIWMRFSDDGGQNWTAAIAASMGSSGETFQRVVWGPNLGSSRDRVFEVSGSEAVPAWIVDAYIDFTGGYQ